MLGRQEKKRFYVQTVYIVHVFQNILLVKERKIGLKNGYISAMISSENPVQIL